MCWGHQLRLSAGPPLSTQSHAYRVKNVEDEKVKYNQKKYIQNQYVTQRILVSVTDVYVGTAVLVRAPSIP